MNVTILAVGKLKESYLREACAEYTKRLGAYCHIKITELPECRLPDNPSEKVIKSALDTEARNTLRHRKRRCYRNVHRGENAEQRRLFRKAAEIRR